MVISRVNFSINVFMGLISWFFLCAGITVFNSYYDKDVDPVAGLKDPPKTTFSMLIGAYLLKFFGLTIALFLNWVFLLNYVIGIVVSILYSHKNFRLKSNGYIALLINFIVGAITFIAASSFSPISIKFLLLGSIASGIFLVSIYLMMQVHQKKEDKKRKDTSIMVLYGRKVTLISAILLMTIAGILSSIALKLSGLNWFYVLTIIIYFSIILLFSYSWLKRKEGATSDFEIMNKLTMRLSYAAILILAVIYVLDIMMKI